MKFLICIIALTIFSGNVSSKEVETNTGRTKPERALFVGSNPGTNSEAKPERALFVGSNSENEYVQAGQVKMSAKDCEELGVKVSIVAFSPQNSSFSLLGLNTPKATGFFDTARKEIHEKISTYCDDDKSLKTIDDFQEQFHGSCEPACSDNIGKFYKDSILGASKEKKNAELTCLSLCNETSHNLEFLKTGARFSVKQSKPTSSAAGDCSGVVSVKGRGVDVKSLSMEEDPGNAIAKEAARKASEK